MTHTTLPHTIRVLVVDNTYRDSVELMRLSADLETRAGVRRAGLMMGTPANRSVLSEAGLITDDQPGGPGDLIVAIAGEPDAVEDALAAARAALAGVGAARSTSAAEELPLRSIAEAVALEPSTGLAIISTPGAYATAEALKALKRGLHVFLFSDNVPIEHEVALKTLARRKGRLVMGPDCGTAILDGLPIGFANAVRRGRIGIVAASGTGLQQVACLIDRQGEGISQAIGVGGRDLDARVGGAMMLASIDYLAADPGTEVLVLLSKPPAPEVAEQVLAAARASGKPVVVNFLGDAALAHEPPMVRVATLEDAAAWAVALARGDERAVPSVLAPALVAEAAHAARQLAPGQGRVEGLYSGGTLCKEAMLLLEQSDTPHRLLDLGDDEFTVGRPHPMIDMRLRNERIVSSAEDPSVAVLLLDVVLGYGSHPDPAGELATAIEAAKRVASGGGRLLSVIASVCGTDADPQGFQAQTTRLVDAGVIVAPTNAQAARLAALVVGAPVEVPA
jgi:succinyl-CoA synthetase alpha subunit